MGKGHRQNEKERDLCYRCANAISHGQFGDHDCRKCFGWVPGTVHCSDFKSKESQCAMRTRNEKEDGK